MNKLDALLAYQQADQNQQQLEAAVRTTENRQRLNKLHKLLRDQQATLKKLTNDLDGYSASLEKLKNRQDSLARRYELEHSELTTLTSDEECTAEEMTEFRVDIEKFVSETSANERDIKQLLANIDKVVLEYQKTRQLAGRAKREYEQLKTVCEGERDNAAKEIELSAEEMKRLEGEVDAAMLAKYKRARQHYPAPVVPVSDGKCSGCRMSLPMLTLRKLSSGDTVTECENCSRLLYAKL